MIFMILTSKSSIFKRLLRVWIWVSEDASQRDKCPPRLVSTIFKKKSVKNRHLTEVSKRIFLYLGDFRFCECGKTRFPVKKSLAGAFFGVFYIPVGLGSFSECFVYDFSLQGRFWDFLHKTVGIFRKSPNVQRKSPTFSEEITTFSEFHGGNHHRIKKKTPKIWWLPYWNGQNLMIFMILTSKSSIFKRLLRVWIWVSEDASQRDKCPPRLVSTIFKKKSVKNRHLTEVSKRIFLYLGDFRFCECGKTRFPVKKSLAGAFFGVFYIPVGLGSFSECFVYDFSLQGRFWDFLHKTVGIFRKSPNVQRKSPHFQSFVSRPRIFERWVLCSVFEFDQRLDQPRR